MGVLRVKNQAPRGNRVTRWMNVSGRDIFAGLRQIAEKIEKRHGTCQKRQKCPGTCVSPPKIIVQDAGARRAACKTDKSWQSHRQKAAGQKQAACWRISRSKIAAIHQTQPLPCHPAEQQSHIWPASPHHSAICSVLRIFASYRVSGRKRPQLTLTDSAETIAGSRLKTLSLSNSSALF